MTNFAGDSAEAVKLHNIDSMSSPTLAAIEFIIPYSKEEITNSDLKRSAYNSFLCQILQCLPCNHTKSVTCIKSYVSKHAQHEKKLESVKIIGPNQLQNEFNSLVCNGILYKNRKIYPFQNSDVNSNAYPKQFTVKFLNLPHFIPDEETISACNLEDFKLSKLRHQLEKFSSEIEAHTGICYADVEIQNESQLEKLMAWNQKSFMNKYIIEEIPIKCQIQKLLQCTFCKENKLEFMGHHTRQCKIKKKENAAGAEAKHQSSSGEEDNESTENQNLEVTQTNFEETFYLDVEKSKICNVTQMDLYHKGFANLKAVQRAETVNIVNEKKVVVNQLRHVQKINEYQQHELFKENKWKVGAETISDFERFKELRKKYDVFFDETKDEETLFCMNLSKQVTMIIRKLKT